MNPSNTSDGFAVRAVVVMASLIALLGLLGMLGLAFTGRAIPDQITQLTTIAATGALALLGRVSSPSGPAPVQIVNAEADPVPTEDVKKK